MTDNQKKPYFRSRSVSQIKDLSLTEIDSRKSGLVKTIDELDSPQGIILSGSVIPDKFLKSLDPARKAYRHGDYIPLEQPLSLEKSVELFETPLRIRERTFSQIGYKVEPNINFLGYKFRPVSGRDRQERFVPFVWLAEGAKLFAYACQETGEGIGVKVYDKAERVRTEGASVVLSVPSRTSGSPRYVFRMEHVPMISDFRNLATIFSLRSSAPVEGSGKRHQMIHKDYDIRYTYEDSQEESDRVVFGPHDIAGYFGIIKHLVDKNKVLRTVDLPVPFRMSPFFIPSKHQMEYYKRLENNVLVKDDSLKAKLKLRKLNIAEKSILLGRALGVFGSRDFAYNEYRRDGKLEKYDSWNWD
ncbi:MAG TPA: hypothetical protein VJH92_04780 [Candidatus Nanoarchaeia archaeon]|nr:hypothetical protein [Candidatus Nanoarchaeia archaeon]